MLLTATCRAGTVTPRANGVRHTVAEGFALGLGTERGDSGDTSPVLHIGLILPLH